MNIDQKKKNSVKSPNYLDCVGHFVWNYFLKANNGVMFLKFQDRTKILKMHKDGTIMMLMPIIVLSAISLYALNIVYESESKTEKEMWEQFS